MREQDNLQCQQVHKNLEAFLDDELTGDELSLVQGHLAQCCDCQEELAFAKVLAKELRSLPTIECPESVARSIVARASAAQVIDLPIRQSTEPLSRWLRAAVILTAIGVGTLALTFLGRIDRKQQQAEIAGTPYTVEELAQAREELRFAFSYFGNIAQKAGMVLRDDVLAKRVAEPPRRALSLFGAVPKSKKPPTEAL